MPMVGLSFVTLSLFLTATSTPHIFTLSLHDALPISDPVIQSGAPNLKPTVTVQDTLANPPELRTDIYHAAVAISDRSEEHTSELQSHVNLVCRLLLEKKKKEHVS